MDILYELGKVAILVVFGLAVLRLYYTSEDAKARDTLVRGMTGLVCILIYALLAHY